MIVQRLRMNDYVGVGIYATLTWTEACSEGQHVFGRLNQTCTRCHARPTVQYDNERAGYGQASSQR